MEERFGFFSDCFDLYEVGGKAEGFVIEAPADWCTLRNRISIRELFYNCINHRDRIVSVEFQTSPKVFFHFLLQRFSNISLRHPLFTPPTFGRVKSNNNPFEQKKSAKIEIKILQPTGSRRVRIVVCVNFRGEIISSIQNVTPPSDVLPHNTIFFFPTYKV